MGGFPVNRQLSILMLVILAGISLTSCSSSVDNGGNGDAEYNLVVVLEKNLNTGQDLIYTRFRRNAVGIPGAMVVVDADTLTTLSGSGQATKTYPGARWTHGELVQILAIDPSEGFLYRDSVVIPGPFMIENVLPANRIWRPVDANAQVEWTTSGNTAGYTVSVRARTISTPSVGFADYYEAQAVLSQTIPSSAFRDSFDNVVPDVYDITILAFNPNFIARPSTPYKVPDVDELLAPINEEQIDGGISAIVVSVKDTLEVSVQ